MELVYQPDHWSKEIHEFFYVYDYRHVIAHIPSILSPLGQQGWDVFELFQRVQRPLKTSTQKYCVYRAGWGPVSHNVQGNEIQGWFEHTHKDAGTNLYMTKIGAHSIDVLSGEISTLRG